MGVNSFQKEEVTPTSAFYQTQAGTEPDQRIRPQVRKMTKKTFSGTNSGGSPNSMTQIRVFVSRKYGFTVRDAGVGYEFRSEWWQIVTDLQRITEVVEVVHGSKVAYRLKRRFSE
jgi:hypothetical protein